LRVADDVLQDDNKRAAYNNWVAQQADSDSAQDSGPSEPKEVTVEDLIRYGEHLMELEQAEKALNVAELALERGPRNPAVWFLRGRALIALESYSAATKTFERLISLKPEEARYHYILGFLYEEADNWNDALKQYREAEKLSSSPVYRARIALLLNDKFK